MKKLLATALATLMVVSLAACGGAASSSSAAASAASSTSEAASASAAGGKLDAIKQAGKLVMLTNAEVPPFEYLGEGGAVSGVDVDLAQLVADELGVELEIVNMDFDLLIEAMNSGKGDIVAAGMSITEERKQQVDFSIPYVDTTILIVVPVGSTIASADDLAGKTIAVQEATTSDLFVTDNVEAKEILRFKSAVEAGTTVTTGKADVAVLDKLTAQNVVDATDGQLALLEEPVSQEQYAMALPKGNEDLLALVDEVLGKAVAADEVNALIAKHMALSNG
ncbi:MAG: transporter substrate-binding domain-containing protein [Oscillospiraceae bacterium]